MAEYAIGRRAPFVMVPRSLIEDPEIDPHTLATYIAVSYFADHGKSTGAYPSDSTAAERVGMGERTFRDRRTKLKEMGWLEWESGQAKGVTNRYTVRQDDKEGRREPPGGSARDAGGGRQEMPTTEEPVTKEPIPIDSIWKYWEDERAAALKLNGKRRPMAQTQKRVQAVRRIWDLGYREQEFKTAIDGCTSSDFHVQRGFLDIELICRDQDHFERFIHKAGQSVRKNGKTPTAAQTQDMVKRLYG